MRIVKEEVPKKADLAKLDLQSEVNLLPANKINVGYATKHALDLSRRAGATSLEILQFKNHCRKIMKTSIDKILKRSLLKYSIVKAVSFLNPDVAIYKESFKKRLCAALKTYVDNQLISGSKADKIERDFLQLYFLSSTRKKLKKYNLLSDKRLDNFWTDVIKTHKEGSYEDLFWFVKSILILSHGNAALERGFLVNKEIIVENQKEKSLIAQRLIYDSIKSSVVNVEDFVVTKSLIHCGFNAYKWYQEDLTKQKEEKQLTDNNNVLKSKNKKTINDLKSQKKKVMDEALIQSARIENEIILLELKR